MEENKRRRNTIKRKLVNHETKTKENKIKWKEMKTKRSQNKTKKPTRKQNVTKRKQNENYIEEFELESLNYKKCTVYTIFIFLIFHSLFL